jgi:hypothetical protein
VDPRQSALSENNSTPRDGFSALSTKTGIPAKSLNVAIGCVGSPGSGKSTYALARAIEYARVLPAYCVAHDIGWKLPDTFPNGQETGVIRHDSFNAAQSRLATDPRGVHCIATRDAGTVIQFAQKIGKASLDSNSGTHGIPVIILIDEVVSAEDAGPYRLGDTIKDLFALRRHANLGVIWTAQSPRLCHFQMLGLGTELVVFKLHHRKDLDALADVGFSGEELDTIKALPPHKWIVKRW